MLNLFKRKAKSPDRVEVETTREYRTIETYEDGKLVERIVCTADNRLVSKLFAISDYHTETKYYDANGVVVKTVEEWWNRSGNTELLTKIACYDEQGVECFVEYRDSGYRQIDVQRFLALRKKLRLEQRLNWHLSPATKEF